MIWSEQIRWPIRNDECLNLEWSGQVVVRKQYMLLHEVTGFIPTEVKHSKSWDHWRLFGISRAMSKLTQTSNYKNKKKKDVCLASDCISGTLVMKIRCPQLSPNNYAFFCFMSTVHPSNIIRVRVWKHDRESDLETHFKILKFTRARMCFAQLSPNNCAFFAYFRIDKILSCPDYRLQNAQD